MAWVDDLEWIKLTTSITEKVSVALVTVIIKGVRGQETR